MPITISLPANDIPRAFIYAVFTMVCALAQFVCLFHLQECQHSVFQFHHPNVTSVPVHLYRNIPHNNCYCSFIKTEHCLTHQNLQIIHALPLVSFVLIVYVIREHISFSGNHTYFLVNLYWFVSTFGFFVILIMTNQSSPHYYTIANRILTSVGVCLFCIVMISTSPERNNGYR